MFHEVAGGQFVLQIGGRLEVGVRNRCEVGGWPKRLGRWGFELGGINTNYIITLQII